MVLESWLSSLVHAKGAATSPMRRLPFGRLPFAAALSALPACVAMRLAPAGMGFTPQFATRGGALRTALSLSGGADGTASDSRLVALRSAMAAAGVEAFVVPSNDPHLSEYTHPLYERRAFISGFTGSAGTVMVTADEALLWTDGRYFLQAEQELGDEWTLMRSGQPDVPTLNAWAAKHCPDGCRVGIDPYVHSVDEATSLATALDGASRELSLVPLFGERNLVDVVWDQAEQLGLPPRPSPPSGKARVLADAVAGTSCAAKLASIGKEAREHGAGAYLVGALDEVAWLLNVRGADVPMCPVLQAYVLVNCPSSGEGGEDSGDAPVTATIFVDGSKLPAEVSEALSGAGVAIAPYESVEAAVRSAVDAGTKILLDPKGLNYALRQAANSSALLEPSVIATPKARKNEAELAGMVDAHLTDGASLAKFFAWLERTVIDEQTPLTEAEVATHLQAFRAAGNGFLELSFPTICGCGPNGAIIHYNPLAAPADKVNTIDGSQLVLLDSGAQYANGTTDVTRTFHLAQPSAWEREAFTRVLKGHIGLSTLVFPDKTPGMAIDAFARTALWQAGLDYQHGTGHGVGAALNVHEGPISISARYGNTHGLRSGMVVSNEPGYYEAGGFGVRIENLVITRERPELTHEKTVGGTVFLGFEPLTHVPIQKKMIDVTLLTPTEVEWLNAYHRLVWEKVAPRLEEGDEGWRWLRDATTAMEVPIAAPKAEAAAAA